MVGRDDLSGFSKLNDSVIHFPVKEPQTLSLSFFFLFYFSFLFFLFTVSVKTRMFSTR